MSCTTYSDQRVINMDKLEGPYNTTLDSYLRNYELYLKNKSSLLNDSPSLSKKYKQRILNDNLKLLRIIKQLYANIKVSNDQHRETKLGNSEKRTMIRKNKKILEQQRALLLEDRDDLLTKEAKLHHLETMYRGKYKTYAGVIITDIIIAILLLLMLLFSF